jgi:hypothetical protein
MNYLSVHIFFVIQQSFLSTSNYLPSYRLVGWFMVFNTTFNNIPVILWWSVLLVEETRELGENHQPVENH